MTAHHTACFLRQMVIEYSLEGVVNVYNQNTGVLCNGPSLPSHIQQLEL